MVATRNRLTGAKVSLKIGTTEYKGDISKYELEASDKSDNVTTFADMEEGASAGYTLKLEMVQSLDDDSLFMYLWKNAGQEADCVIAPAGNTTPTSSQPHITCRVRIPATTPTLGGEASKDQYTSEIELEVINKPTWKTSAL